jgi:hypothetical protein
MHTAIYLDFAGQKFTFWLPLPRVVELERSGNGGAGKSIFRMFDEIGAGLGFDGTGAPVYVSGGDARVDDVRNTIRLALLGGNSDGADQEVGPKRAAQLVEDYVYPARPLVEGLALAWAILNAAINGIAVKKNEQSESAEDATESLNPSPSASSSSTAGDSD